MKPVCYDYENVQINWAQGLLTLNETENHYDE